MPFLKGHKGYGTKESYKRAGQKLSQMIKERGGHWSKGEHLSEKHKRKISNALQGDKNPMKHPESRKKMSVIHKGKKHSEETKGKISELKKGNKNTLGKHWKIKDVSKMKGLVPWNKGKRLSATHREKLRRAKLRSWQDEEYVKMMMRSHHVKPNKLEINLKNLLNEILPNEYKYVGDGQFIVGSKCPDFLNISGKKKLIELYGDYWHRNHNPQDRIEYFRQYGFDTLVIWESELQESNLNKRISEFTLTPIFSSPSPLPQTPIKVNEPEQQQ